MPSKRTTELTAIDAVSGVDLVMVVDDPSGTAISKKATVTQVLVNTAKTNAPNTFTGDQTIDGDLVVTGEINPVIRAEQMAKVEAFEGRAAGDPSGSRTLMSADLTAGMSVRHDKDLGEGRISVGNYNTQVYQRLIVQAESLRVQTGVTPTIAEHLRVHPSGGVTIGTDHSVDPGVGKVVAGALIVKNSSYPSIILNDPSQSADARLWQFSGEGNNIFITGLTDALNAQASLQFNRVTGTLTVRVVSATQGLGTTPLNADQLTAGTVPVAALPATVARTDVTNTFPQPQTVQGLTINGSNSVLSFNGAGPVNGKCWRWLMYGDGNLRLEGLTDGFAAVSYTSFLIGSAGMSIYQTLTVNGNVTAPSFVESGKTVPMGYWQDVSFSASNFVGGVGGMLVTVSAGQVGSNRYMLLGKTLFWQMNLDGFSIAGVGGPMQITLPAGLICGTTQWIANPGVHNCDVNGGGWKPFLVNSNVGGNYIGVYPLPSFAWGAGAGANNVWMNLMIQVQ